MSEDIVKIKYKATAELVADGIKKAIKPSDVKREAQQTAKAMQSAMDGQKIEIPAEIVPDTSKFDKAKKEAEKPIKTPVKLETEDVDLPLLGKTPIKLSIDKDSRTAIKKTLKDAEKASKSLIDSAARTVKKIGSANYLEELTKNEQQSVSNAVAKVKRNNPGISEDKLKTFEQNLTLDRRAKKTHDTLSENFRIPSSSSKAYGQEMYEAAIAATKIQAAVKIREDLHNDERYTQFLSKNDRSKSYNGNTLKIPGKFIDQIQTGLYEHFGVGKLGIALSSGKNWTGIQGRMTQSIDSFGAGLSAAINASSGKRITKEFQARIDSAVKTAVGMSIDDAISHLSGTKGTKESKKALSLLDYKQNGEYKYSIDDIYDILMDRTPTGKNATAGEDAVSGVNYKGFSDLFAALQVYQRSGSSKLDKNHVKRLSELVSAIVSEFQDSTYNAQTVIDSINTSLDQAQIEAEKVAKEQSKIEDKSKPKKSSKKSSSTTPKKKQTGAAKVEHYIPNIEDNSTYAKLANQNYTTKSKEEALQKLSESFETWNDALPDTHEAYGLKYIYRRYMLEAYQMGASIDELSKFSLTDLSNKAPRYFVKMVEKAGEQFKVFADLYDYVASINKSLFKKNTIKNLLDSIAKGQIAAKRKFGESLELTDGGDLIGISESYKPDFVKEFISLQKKRQQDLNKEIARVTGTESNINVLPEYYNSLLKLFEPSATPQIEEKKIKETAKTGPKKVEESKPKKAESSPKTEESKKAEKKIEQKQDKTEEIEEPKYSFSPRLTKNNQKKHDSRFTGRLYDQKQLMDFASAPLNRSPKIKSNSGIFDKNGNYYVVNATRKTNKESVETRQVTDNYDSILKSIKKIDAYNKSELGLMQKQEKYTAGTDEHNSIAKQIKEVTDARKQEQESIKKIVGNNGVDKWIENNKSVLDKEKKDISELATARRNVETSGRSITDYINQSSISDRYEAAISDIKELQKAQEKLSNLQKEQIENPNKDLSSDIADVVSEYKRLSGSVKDFRENVYDAEKSQKELTDNRQFKEYNSAYDQTTKNVKDNQKSLSQSLKDAYKTQNRYEKKLLTPGTYNNSQNVTDAIEQLEYAKRTASFIEKQMREVHGNEYANKEIARIQSSIQAKTGSSLSIFNNSEIMSANIGNISEKLSAYTASIEKANKATEEFTNKKQGISEKISALKDDYNNGNLSVSDYAKRMQEINNDFSALKEYMTTGAGKNTSEYTEVFNKLNKLENSTNKVGQYHEILQGFKSEFQKIKSDYEDDGDLDKYNQSVSNLISRMKDFQKVSKNFVATNSKGTLIGESIGKVSDINDATTTLENYATKLGYANKTSQSINESTGKVNMTFENASGNVLKMSGVIEELNENMKGLRVSTNVLSSGSGGSGSLLGGLKNLVSGNFKSIVGEIGNSVANVQILGQAFQQMKDGFNTFLDFNKGLTNISYTMDMSKEQLSSLGSSAVDMAKDLSMSLDNTMDIYQIYANMNTTSKEIQETAKPTAILSNLSGVDASTAADQVQGILQQFHMLEDGSTTAADASMHVVDVLDKISGNIGMDYAKGIKVISDAVQASGQVAYDAGMSYEQLAAVSAKVAERTREDGSSIGNAMKTIITRISKVGSMPEYAADVSNEDLSQASESLHKVGVEVYNTDGSFRDLDTILSELNAKWDGLTDAQKANISYNVAATRQTSKFKNILEAWTDSMNLANEATTTSGNAEANQEKYMESFSGKIQAIKTQMDEFWLNFYNSDQVSGALDFVQGLTKGFTGLEEAIGPIPTLITAVFSALTVKNAATKGLEFLVGKDGQASGLANAVG